MGRRLFAAIELPPPLIAALDSYGRSEAQHWRGAKWTATDDLHITVGFFGNVADGKIEPMTKALAEVCSRHAAFQIVFQRVELAPPGRRPTMIWASFLPSGDFDALSADVRAAVVPFAPEMPAAKESRPHVTLARFKDRVAVRPGEKTAPLGADPGAFIAGRVALFESKLASGGPTYEKIAEFVLGGRPRRM